ncbi:MAG TPA: DUF302 domain-containing protein [Chitinophagaceae bacterium]
MSYNITKRVKGTFEKTIYKVTEELQKEGFGILTEVNLKDKFKEKLDVDFRNYVILGACNPKLAYEAVQQEDKIGLMLPCNVLVQEFTDGEVEVSAINPMASIGSVENDKLETVASEVSGKLRRVINAL